jgi:predicted nucleic acid-binding protein
VILADTSAWVEYDRATGSATDRRLSELIATGGPIAVTEPVVMEVLAGARSDSREADLPASPVDSRGTVEVDGCVEVAEPERESTGDAGRSA